MRIMEKALRQLQAEAMRKARLEELQFFIKSSGFQGVMNKAISFLTDGAADKITLNITTGTDSYTDGKNITLGMCDYFFDPQFRSKDWITIFKALLAHEIQHINSSNFSDIKDVRAKYAKLMTKKGLPSELTAKIAQDMLNIMEDGRIENIIVHKYPGYRLPFLMLNQMFLAEPIEGAADTPGQEFLDFVNTCLCYTKTGRLPAGISVYAGTRFETEFKNVQSLFDLVVDARTSKQCKEICLKMLTLTADYFSDLLKEERDQQMAQQSSNGGNGGQECEYTSSYETEYNDFPNGSPLDRAESEASAGKSKYEEKKSGKDGKGRKKGSASQKRAQSGEGGNGQDNQDSKHDRSSDKKPGNKTGKNRLRMPRDPRRRCGTEDWTDNFSGYGAEAYDTRELTADEIAALRRGVTDELDAVEKEETSKSAKDTKARDVGMERIEELYKDEYIRFFSELFPTINATPLPSELERAARKLESVFERVIRVKRSEKRNMRVGNISFRDLYRVGMRDGHIFVKKGKPMKADLAVFLLLDNSGSMGGQGAEMDMGGRKVCLDKSTLSRTAAGIIERSLSKFAAIKISLFDVSGGIIRHSTVKKFDEKAASGSKCYSSLNPVGIGGGNKDGYSIRVATKDLLARREAKKVLIVLSDGLPSDYNGGPRAGMDDVKAAVHEARRKGIIVIPIMFGRVSDREKMRDNFSYMYGKHISADPVDITNEFQKLFVKLINQT